MLFPTLGGPTTATTTGGGSSGVRSTTGKWCFLVCMSNVRLAERAARTVDLNVKALTFWDLPSPTADCFRCFFLSALGPACLFLWLFCFASSILHHGAYTQEHCLGAFKSLMGMYNLYSTFSVFLLENSRVMCTCF